MHKFLRAIGFSRIDRKTLDGIIDNIITHPQMIRTTNDTEGNEFSELSREFAPNLGIVVRGFYDENDRFHRDYYFPCFKGREISTQELIEIEKYAEKESYAGVCDDLHLGITLIFYLQNVADVLAVKGRNPDLYRGNGAILAGLSTEGKILLPMDQRIKEKNTADKYDEKSKTMARAMEGNEEAMMDLTMDDFEMYTDVFNRVQTEDILSIVTSTFMPYGVESDQYSVLGEIREYKKVTNSLSGEKIYCMKLECNGMIFDVCINEADLMGVPEVGRRFKGSIWMQGNVCLENWHLDKKA